MIRVIGTINDNYGTEEVFFTDEIDAPVGDFMRAGDEVLYDELIEDNLPISFPRETTLKKEF